MSKDGVWQEAAECLIGLCLVRLIELGHVELEQVSGKWYVEFNEAKLQGEGLAGAATLDIRGCPVVYLLPRLNTGQLKEVISHESVHLAQICKGDLIPGFGYKLWLWKGQRYPRLPPNHPAYFDQQPWEKEAKQLQPVLYEYLRSKEPAPDT